MNFKKGDKKFGLDFGKLQENKIVVIELEITGTETIEPNDNIHAPFEAYTYTQADGTKGKIAVDFADIKLKDTKQEIIDEVKKDLEDNIKNAEDNIKVNKESIKLTKKLLKQLD